MKTNQIMLATAIIAGGLTFATTSQAQQEPGKGKSGQGKARPGQGETRPGQGQRPRQGQRPQRGGGFSRFNPYAQLNLTEDQQKKMDAIQKVQTEEMAKLRESGSGGDFQTRIAKYRALSEKYQKQRETILTDEQKKKMAELRAQQPQRPSRRDPYAALNLTDAQKKKVTEIRAAESAERRKLFSDGNSEGMREKMTAMREKTNKQIEAILTDEQKKKFKEMQSQRPTRPQGRPGRSDA